MQDKVEARMEWVEGGGGRNKRKELPCGTVS